MRVKILGPLYVEDHAGRVLDVHGTKLVSMFTALLVEGSLSDEATVTHLWGESSPTTARAQVYTYVSRLRSALGAPELITRQGEGYRLDRTNVWLDANEFRRLSHEGIDLAREERLEEAEDALSDALDLWRGPVLAEVTPSLRRALAPPLEQTRLQTAEVLGEVRLRLGHHRRHLPMLCRLVGEHPLHEGLVAQLMEVLWRAGDRAGALEAFRRLRSSMQEDLGLDPSAALQKLYIEILRSEPVLRVVPPHSPLVPPPLRCDVTDDADESRGHAVEPVRAQNPPRAHRTVTASPENPLARPLAAVARSSCVSEADRSAWQADLDKRRAADPTRPVVGVVVGMPGLGKGRIAGELAALSAAPGAQVVYVSLRTREGGPVSARQAMVAVLEFSGEMPEGGRHDHLSVSTRYRTLMSRPDRVLVLTDAVSDTQVMPMLPTGAGSVTIITGTRVVVSLESCLVVRRKPLTPLESTQFLERLLGREVLSDPRAWQRLVEFCGGLPTLLEIVAKRVGSLDGIAQARTLLARLTCPELRSMEIELAGDCLIQLAREQVATLSQTQSSVLAAALQLPQPFPRDDLQRIVDVPPKVALSVLRDMHNSGLMTAVDSSRRWQVSRFLLAMHASHVDIGLGPDLIAV